MDNGSQLYTQLFNGTEVLRSGLLTDDHEHRSFQLVSVDLNARVDGDACVLAVKQTFRHDMKLPKYAVFAAPMFRKWALLKVQVETAKHKVASETAAAKKLLLHQDDRVLLKVPFRVYPDDLVTVTLTMFRGLRRRADGDGSVLEERIERDLIGSHEANRESTWEMCFRSEMHDWITTLMMAKVRLDATARTDVDTLCIKPLGDAKASTQGRAGWVAWGSNFSEGTVLPGDLNFEVRTAPQGSLVEVEIIRPQNRALLPEADQHAIVTSISATEAAARQLGLTDEDFAAPNAEYMFLLDVSGSMYTCIHSAAKAIRAAIMALPASCGYNIILFGGAKGTYTLFTTECAANNDANQQKAKALLDNICLAPGGTDIHLALKMAYAMPVKRGHGRHVVIVTNSPAGSPRESLQLVRDHIATTRVHCVCVDPFYDDVFCAGIAHFCGGVVAQSYPSKLADNLLGIVKATCKPCLADVELVFDLESAEDAADTAAASNTIRPCYSAVPLVLLGERLELYAFAGGDLSPRTAVNFACMVGSHSVRVSDHFMALDTSSDMYRELRGDAAIDLIPHIGAAVARVAVLTQPLWGLDTTNLAFTGRTALRPEEIEEIVRLSSTFGFVTPLTTMSNTSSTVTVKPKEAEVITEAPQVLPLDIRRTRMAGQNTTMTPARPVHIGGDGAQRDPDHPNPKYFNPPPGLTVPEMVQEIIQKDIINAVCGRPDVNEVLNMQHADGSWTFTERAVQYLGVNYRKLKKATPEDQGGDGDAAVRQLRATCWATAACVALVQMYKKHHERNALLPMVVGKAELYLQQNGCGGWVAKAAEFLKQHSVHAVAGAEDAG